MEVENPEAAEDASGGGFTNELGRFAVKSCILGVAEGLKGVGDREREAGEGLTVDLSLGFWREKADIDAVGCVLVLRLGEDGGEIVRRLGLVRLKQSAIERGSVRDEKAEIARGETGGQPEGDADIARGLMPGAQGGLDLDRVPGMSEVGRGDARLIEIDGYLPGNCLNVQIDRADDALTRAVRIEAGKLAASEESSHHGRGRLLAGGGPEIERDRRKAGYIDGAGYMVAEGLGALVRFEERLVEDYLDGKGREGGQVEDVNVHLAGTIGGVESDVDGDHVGLSAQHAANGGLAILRECADGDAGVDDLEGIERRSEGDNDVGGGHGERDGTGAKDRVAAGEKLLRIDPGDRAGGGDFEIAANKLHADGGAGDECGRGGGFGDGARG